jgi:ribosomal protein S18 acetylase RimI-like enzyme
MQEDAMPATIRRACAADIDAIAARQGGRSGQDPARLGDRIAAELSDSTRRLWVAVVSGAVVGYARLTRHDADQAVPDAARSGLYLGGVVFDPLLRRQGIGEPLTRTRMCAAFAEERGVWYIANAGNHASIAMHSALGFREITGRFEFPGVRFTGGVGILFQASQENSHRELPSKLTAFRGAFSP